MKTETICFGDCLEHLKRWVRWNNGLFERQPSLADLIYLDPPWNSKANYNILFGSDQASEDETQTAQETAFTDMWQWNDEAKRRVQLITGEVYHDDYADHPAFKSILSLKTLLGKSGMLAYCSYMAERLALLREMLKPTGSIYLHCDPHASHYLKMVMDNIFGPKNLRNQIVWERTKSGKSTRYAPRTFGNNTDIIFFYSKSDKYPFYPYKELNEAEQERLYPKVDKDGRRYALRSLYRGRTLGPCPNLCYEWKGYTNRHESGWAMRKELLEEEFQKGNIVIKANGKLERRQYLADSKGGYLSNVWHDIPPASAAERQYPTQKPLKLLKRIIEASTNEGDVVLDPFCGCGTAVVAAHQLKRKFVGIDISLYATETVAWSRLTNEAKMPEDDIRVIGIPADYRSAQRLAKDDPFAFEIFAVEACVPGMVANKSQRRDRGIDGKGWLLHPVIEKGKKKNKVIVQVKAGKPTIDQVKAFGYVIQNTEGVIAGAFITLEKDDWTDDMRRVKYEMGTFKYSDSAIEYPRLQHWHVGQFFYKTERRQRPHLPEMADPLSGKEMTIMKQTGFLVRTEN